VVQRRVLRVELLPLRADVGDRIRPRDLTRLSMLECLRDRLGLRDRRGISAGHGLLSRRQQSEPCRRLTLSERSGSKGWPFGAPLSAQAAFLTPPYYSVLQSHPRPAGRGIVEGVFFIGRSTFARTRPVFGRRYQRFRSTGRGRIPNF
jgi:hypothetical protein